MLRRGKMAILAQSAEDVFHVHDGVIDQLADRHGQSTQRHGVDRQPETIENQCRDRQGKWNGRERDEGRPKVEQEQEEDNNDENAAVAECFDNVLDGQIDERLLLIKLRQNVHILR